MNVKRSQIHVGSTVEAAHDDPTPSTTDAQARPTTKMNTWIKRDAAVFGGERFDRIAIDSLDGFESRSTDRQLGWPGTFRAAPELGPVRVRDGPVGLACAQHPRCQRGPDRLAGSEVCTTSGLSTSTMLDPSTSGPGARRDPSVAPITKHGARTPEPASVQYRQGITSALGSPRTDRPLSVKALAARILGRGGPKRPVPDRQIEDAMACHSIGRTVLRGWSVPRVIRCLGSAPPAVGAGFGVLGVRCGGCLR